MQLEFARNCPVRFEGFEFYVIFSFYKNCSSTISSILLPFVCAKLFATAASARVSSFLGNFLNRFVFCSLLLLNPFYGVWILFSTLNSFGVFANDANESRNYFDRRYCSKGTINSSCDQFRFRFHARTKTLPNFRLLFASNCSMWHDRLLPFALFISVIIRFNSRRFYDEGPNF